MCLAITTGQKMFEVLTHRKPKFSPGTRLVGGPSGNCKGKWPVWFVAEVSGLQSLPINDVLEWLRISGLLAPMTVFDVGHLSRFITNRALAGGATVHVVLFDRVHDIRELNIDLSVGVHPFGLPHPRASSLLAFLLPTLYWHSTIEGWLQCVIQALLAKLTLGTDTSGRRSP